MSMKKIKVKETKMYWGNFQGSLESIITSLQKHLDAGWEGIEIQSNYSESIYVDYFLYKYREETDKEYDERMKQLVKEKEKEEKAKERKLQQLKKDLASLSDADKKLLGL